MKKCVLVVACLVVLTAGMPASPATRSVGCGSTPKVPTGASTSRTVQVNGLERSYILRVPASYDASTPVPLIVSHHGWTCSASEDERDGGLGDQAEKSGFIVAFLNGWDDNSHTMYGGWKSWNGAGTVYSNQTKAGCLSWGGTSDYCYESCSARVEVEHDGAAFKGCDSVGCDWTTCVSSDDFNVAVLDLLEAEFCIDVTREYATGQSNGAIYTFHLGATLSDRLAAIAPISGSFMHDYIKAPSMPVPVLDCTGTQDRTVPVNDTTYGNGAVSNEGWWYETLDAIWAFWEPANGCSSTEAPVHWPTSLDGTQDLYCWGKTCGGNPVVRCAWDGGHNYYGNNGTLNAALVWEFLSRFSRPTHLGLGKTRMVDVPARTSTEFVPQSELQSDDVSALSAVSISGALEPREVKGNAYGNPANGCLPEESVLHFTDGIQHGSSCAPKMGSAGSCVVGGYRKAANGCPGPNLLPQCEAQSEGNHSAVDAYCEERIGDGSYCKYYHPDSAGSGYCQGTDKKDKPIQCCVDQARQVFPTCLALSPIHSTKAVGDEFHCVLTCDRTKSSTEKDFDADDKCPEGAVCMSGQLRFGHVGICVYTRQITVNL